MRKTNIFIVLVLLVSLFSFNTNAQVNVGTGTQTGLSLPIEPYYGYTYSQSIYLASEINASGSITGVTFYGDAGISALTNSSTWVVYAGHTTKTSFAGNSDWETGLTQVFSGTISVVGNNVTVTFSTPFIYNGTDNLIIAVDENGASYDNNADEFLCTSTANDRALTYRSDATNPDPLGTLPSATFVRQAVPNIQFIGITQTCPLPSALTATNVATTSADFGWTENGTATTWNVEHGAAGFTPTGTPTISGTMSNPITIGSLMPNTSYDAYVQADCGPDSSAWVGPFTFTTLQSCPDPSALMISNITSSTADFGWTENGTATTWNVEYGTAGFTPTGTPTISGTTSNPVTLNSLTDNTTYDAYVQADCGADSSSWIGPVTFTTECAPLVAPWLEPFSTNTLPSCWSQSGDNNWEYGSSATTPTGFAAYGAAGLADNTIGGGGTFIGMDGSDNGNGEVSVLLTPIVDVSGLMNGQFTYWVFSNNVDDAAQNKLIVEVFDGAAWVQVDSIQQNLGANWVEFSTPLSSLTITGDVRARFTITGDNSGGGSTYYNDILIDDVAFNEIPTCPIPTALMFSNITATTADFGWTENGPATTWNVEYGVAGFTPTGTPTISGTTSNPVALTSLTGNTTYDAYLQSDCGPDSSFWVGPVSFTTACPTYIPDYLQDFSTYLPDCWEEAQGLLTPSTVLTPGTSSWVSDGFANSGTSGAARMNIWTTGQDEWLISPSIDLTGGPFQLEYDVALTTYAGTAATTMDADDSLAVVISTDNGATWSNANILKTYTSGSEPSNTGDHEYIDLSAYTGVVKFGFYAASTQNLVVDNDIFIDNFEVTALCLPEYTTDVQTACDSLTWIDGNTYTSNNNTASVTLTNAAGCDSIVTLDLTILTTFGTDVQTACESFTWIDGMTYTSSNNTAMDTLVNAAGCDSIVTLDLTILTPTFSTDLVAACDSFTWIDGVTYTASNNTATDTLVNAAGCDSIVTLDLTIALPTFGTDVQTACDSFTWIDGVTYTASNNTAMDTLVNAAGCDSIVTLDLTIATATTGTDVQAACDSYTWIDGNTYTASNNTATFTLTNAAGCDSVVTLDLTISGASTGTDVVTACDSYTWIDGNTYTTDNNTATFTLTNTAGCDSIVTLDLTISSVSNIGVTVNDPTLTADIPFVSGVSLQWLKCPDYSPVSNVISTAPSFTPLTSGDYAVRIVENGCVDTSACYTVLTANLTEVGDLINVSIVPNPTNNLVTVSFDDSEAELTILDINGKLIDRLTIKSGDTVDMTLFENGVYLFTLTSDSIRTVERVVKQ